MTIEIDYIERKMMHQMAREVMDTGQLELTRLKERYLGHMPGRMAWNVPLLMFEVGNLHQILVHHLRKAKLSDLSKNLNEAFDIFAGSNWSTESWEDVESYFNRLRSELESVKKRI